MCQTLCERNIFTKWAMAYGKGRGKGSKIGVSLGQSQTFMPMESSFRQPENHAAQRLECQTDRDCAAGFRMLRFFFTNGAGSRFRAGAVGTIGTIGTAFFAPLGDGEGSDEVRETEAMK